MEVGVLMDKFKGKEIEFTVFDKSKETRDICRLTLLPKIKSGRVVITPPREPKSYLHMMAEAQEKRLLESYPSPSIRELWDDEHF